MKFSKILLAALFCLGCQGVGFAQSSSALVTTLAGSGSSGYADGTGTQASFSAPAGVAVDGNGNVYVADSSNHRIRKITANGTVSTLAGSGSSGYADGNGTSARFSSPWGVAVDGSGNVYVADSSNHRIRKISPSGIVTTLAGSGVAGFANGYKTSASFNNPFGIVVDVSGNVYVADIGNHRIRKIDGNGNVTTLAGSGTEGAVDGLGTSASFAYPRGLALDGAGNLYVGDWGTEKIRRIDASGNVTTLAGSGGFGFADGQGTSAIFARPNGVAVDGSGNVYVADHNNHRIRKIDAGGTVSTLAGSGNWAFSDGQGTSSSFGGPIGIAVDRSGNVYVGDYYNNRIRKITTSSAPKDTDGDGVNDYREQKDGTDTNNASSFDPLSKGLVAFYPFNGNANDESGFGKNGKIVGGVVSSIDRFGASNKSYFFDGSTGLITSADPDLIKAEDNLTLVTWIKATEEEILGVERTSGTSYAHKYIVGGGGNHGGILLAAGTNGISVLEHGFQFLPVVLSYPAKLNSEWVQVVVTSSNNGPPDLYINGKYVRTGLSSGRKKILSAFSPEEIAGIGGGAYGKFKGNIDDVRIYNRALSAVEVSQLYSKESGSSNKQVEFDLGNIVAGGDGQGNAIAGNEGKTGIDTTTGLFTTGMNFGHTYYNSYNSVSKSTFIDGVFNLGANKINSAGLVYDLLSGDGSNASFDYITNNREIGGSRAIQLKGKTYTSGIGMCAGSGITFNLKKFREVNGAKSLTFASDFGTMSGGDWKVRGYAVLSNSTKVLSSEVTPILTANMTPHQFSMNIPEEAEFLTLMVGTGGDGITDDHAGFGNARIIANPNMVTVQGGTLPQGSELAGQKVGTFQIGKYETTWGEWKTVRDWAVANGYADLANVGAGSGDNHPVRNVNWYDVVKWCNAKSEMEGLAPAYFANGVVYKSGDFGPDGTGLISKSDSADGYRLPAEAEWEWAARGGLSSVGYTYSGSNDLDDVGWWFGNSRGSEVVVFDGGGTWPVGQKAPNELGIYDMSGNVYEWCSDLFLTTNRRLRGGGWRDDNIATMALLFRNGINSVNANNPGGRAYQHQACGFRLARSAKNNMVTIQGGSLPQGSQLAGQTVGTFQIGRTEVTWGEWKAVRNWAVVNGYTDLADDGRWVVARGSSDDHAVTNVSWYNAIKWCNAKSELDGLEPVYQVGGVTYKTNKTIPSVKTTANGYRLPLEKEWEWAAKNSALGLYDLEGNIWEWCWDAGTSDEFGGSGPYMRRIRNFSSLLRPLCYGDEPQDYQGFRLARNAESPADTTAPVIAITSISANARLTSANATFGGTITETGSKPALQYRLGSTGNWTSSTVGGSASPYSFSQLVALTPGLNTVQFQSKDDAENVSALASIDVSYVVASTLTITAPNAADGSVTSGFGGSSSREVGVSYTVTATPASGMLFKEWLKNGTSAGANATHTFTMQPGLTLTPVFVPDFAALGGFYNGLVGVGAIGSGSAADMQAFAANNGFIQITSGANGALSGVLKIEGKSHSFNGTMGSNKRATITVPRPGKGNATLSLSLVSALPGEISGNVTTSGAPLAFRALRAAYTAGAAKHALAGKRYAIVLPPPSGLAMGYGHATLTVEDNGAAVLSGVLANGQAVNAGARIVDDGAGNWVFPVYVGASGIFTGEIVIPKTTPASGSELGGSLEWLKPVSNTGLFKSGFLKSLQPLGATHSATSAGLGGAAFSLTLDPAKRILPAAVVQTGTWANSGSPILTTPVKNGLTLSFNPLSGKFEGSFTRTVNGAPLPTPIQGTLFSRPITIPGGATLRGAGFFMSGNASTAIEITSNGTAEPSANMVTVQGGALPSSSQLAGQVVAAFQIGKYETTWGEWKTVRDWAVANNKGYDLAGVGDTYPSGSGDNFPVINVSWYDVLKWSNARSEKEGLTPVYQVSGATYKTGEVAPTLNASANGYRLPSEKEWEWAARGGVSTQGYTYSGSNTISAVAWTIDNSGDGTKAVGTKAANELGIYDMSGNVWEWCEDVASTSYRRFRGGGWSSDAGDATVAYRGRFYPDYRSNNFGFRLARSSGN